MSLITNGGYGNGGYGASVYGVNRNYSNTVTNWPYPFTTVTDNNELTDFLYAITYPLATLDSRRQTVYENLYVETASGYELEQLAAPIGVSRRTNETDDQLRYRTKLRKAISATNDSFDDFIAVLEVAFGDNVSDLSLQPATSDPGIIITVPEVTLDSVPVTQQTLVDILRDAVPINDSVTIATQGNLLLGGEDFTPNPNSRIGTGELAGDQDA